tara:strand:+ start:353 stop:490 length:138 start_codon:yes stop_codon:yes gene_type:complete
LSYVGTPLCTTYRTALGFRCSKAISQLALCHRIATAKLSGDAGTL